MKITQNGIEVPFVHWQRMKRGGTILGINVPDYLEWINNLEEYLLGIHLQPPHALRVSLTQAKKDSSTKLHSPKWSFSVRQIPYSEEQYQEGVGIIFLEKLRQDSISLTYIKSPDYPDNQSALLNMKDRGAFEGIWINQRGELVEGTKSNIFFVQNGTLYTPSLTSGCLAGTRRGIVIDLAHKLNIPLQERDVYPMELLEAEEVFLTNALMGIMPVTQAENRQIRASVMDGITQALIKAYKVI
ncbi:MAG: aminotransferase class IV [Peptococcaceae bacterium]|nr:aminotransferase class IV [Peptococcaceae bacterium]